MAKKKKTSEKLYAFYRGPVTRPSQVATDDQMEIIRQALLENLNHRDSAYCTSWMNQEVDLRLELGLTCGLRYLKQKRTLALIYDDSAAQHLTKYLNEFSRQLNIPSIQAKGLLQFAPQLKLKTLLVISVLRAREVNDDMYLEPGRVKPKQFRRIPTPESIVNLFRLLSAGLSASHRSPVVEFRPPKNEKVPLSRLKKQRSVMENKDTS